MDKRLLKIVIPSVACGIILYILSEGFVEWTYTSLQIHQTELKTISMHIPDKTFLTSLQKQKTELERKTIPVPNETFHSDLQIQKTELKGKSTHTSNETFQTNLQIQETELERKNMHIPDEKFHTNSNIQKTALQRKNMRIPNETFHTDLQNQKTELERKYMHIPNETFHTNLQIHKTEFERKHTNIADETIPTTIDGLSCESREPRFLNETRPVVALASFAGSGNTWARQILESVTGIHTGSIYADFYKGSKRCHTEGGVFIIKTHFANATAYKQNARKRRCKKTEDFTRAIVIVRNPYDAMIANFNRVEGGKIEYANKRLFFSEDWKNFVWRTSIRWKEHLLFWLTKFRDPMHVIIYEELRTNTVKETYKVLKFLDFPVDFKALHCLNKDREQEKYYRASKPSWLTKDNLYTPEMREIVNSRISDVYHKMEPSNISKAIENYLLK